MNKRLKTNRQILRLIETLIEENPDWRFGQLMINVGLHPDSSTVYNVESDYTLKMLTKELERLGLCRTTE